MAEVASGGSDAVAVDIEVFEDCVSRLTPISSPTTSEDGKEEIVAFRKEDLNRNWISSIKGKILLEPEIIKSSSASESCSIHRVPTWRRRKNSDAYNPKVISIGPLHYDKRKGELRAMEEHKRKYLHAIVSRKHEDDGWLEDCLAAVKGLEERARNCYSEVIPLDSDSFVEMMAFDGCFILELFRREYLNKDHVVVRDVILELDWLKQAIHFDLGLMENQIPFFILQSLSVLIDPSGPSPPLVENALNFFYKNPSTLLSKINGANVPILHLLHLQHAVYVLCHDDEYTQPTEIPRIDCASRLKERGIKFRKREVVDCEFLDIKFDEGVIEIPTIEVWDKTDREFLNLIAFEQCYHLHCRSYITTYYHFMDCLINTAKDVEILCREGIIDNRLGDDELVASHYNSMVREASKYPKDFYLSDVCGKINKYSQRKWPRLKASLAHDYFNTPWASISFLAAVLLLLLTLTQTFFTSFPKFAAGN